MRHGRLLFFALLCLPCFFTLVPLAMAGSDAVADALDKAKAQRAAARTGARAALIQAFDSQIKDAGTAGDLEKLKTLTNQKDAFMSAGVLPDAPSLKDAAAQYTQTMRKADGELVAAFESAIEGYNNQSRADLAMAVRQQRRELLDGDSEKPAAATPEAVGFLLDKAKADYHQAVGDAKNVYLQAIDARINKASDAGDLKSVTKLQAARTAVAADAPLPEGFNDSIVTTAATHYTLAVSTANRKLADAYTDAVKNDTRLRAIDKAQAVQTEFDATGLARAATVSPGEGEAAQPGGMVKLTRFLPAYLTASGDFAVDKDGITPARNTVISTKASDFLSKNFIFDVTVKVPKNEEWVIVGLGDMTDKGSLRLVIRNDGGWGRRGFLTKGDPYGEHIGDIHNGESYDLRIERHDGPVTLSIGSITDGKFTADMSRTVADPIAIVPGMSEKRVHLYFEDTVTYSQVRLLIGAAATESGGGSASPIAPVKIPEARTAAAAAAAPATVSTPVATPAPTPAPVVVAPAAAPAPAIATPTAAAGDCVDGVYPLNTDKLPIGFTATGTYSVSPAGMKLPEKTQVITKEADFLSKDFVYDVTVDITRKDEWFSMGVGDGTNEGSIRIVIRKDGASTGAFLTQCDKMGKRFSVVRESGDHVLRVERHGTAITVSIGTKTNGKFVSDASQTIPDPAKSASKMSEQRAHLFFGGAKATWSEISLRTGGAAAGDASVSQGK